ncbi:MAG TPA: transporter [Vicinamibacterales bacterium]|nr:transporter [Vicinamibacterales bacterium]
MLPIGASALAQTADDRSGIAADRPDFTESADTVSKGVVQLESGATYDVSTRLGGRASSLTFPQSLLRIGIAPGVELRLGADGYLRETVGGLRTSGYSDVEVGMKVRLLEASRAGIDLALIPTASLPVGRVGFTSGGVDPTIKVAWGRELAGGFDVSGNLNVASLTGDGGRYTQRAMSVSVDRQLARGWTGFIETYGVAPAQPRSASAVTADWGVAHAIGRTRQFDVEAGRGLTPAASDWFAGFGFAVRAF